MITRFLTLAALAAPAIMGSALAAAPAAPSPAVSVSAQDLAAGGYDVVAYFAEGRPVKGSAMYQREWNGATWRFASAKALADFSANPATYAPQYGGYCAWAVSQGYIAPGDPQHWKIVDGRLFLNFNARAKELWEADQANAIVRANGNWPSVLRKNQNR